MHVYHCLSLSHCLVTDVDECDGGVAECHRGEECVNVVGSYKCLANCKVDYRRNTVTLNCEGSFSFGAFICSLLCNSNVSNCSKLVSGVLGG